MVETAGLENRYAGNGIEGSNPSLSARSAACGPHGGPGPRYLLCMPPLLPLLALLAPQGPPVPGDVCLTGLCGLVQPFRPVPPGVFFLAIGIIALGIVGLKRRAG